MPILIPIRMLCKRVCRDFIYFGCCRSPCPERGYSISDDPPTPCDIVERLVATLKQIKRKDEMTAALERAGVKSHAFSWDQERSMTEYLNDARSQAFIAGAVSSCTAHEMAELLVRGPDERAQRFVLLTAELLSKHDVQVTYSKEEVLSRDRAVTEFLETGDGTFEDACTELLLLEAKKLLSVRGLSAKLARIDSASARRLTSSSPPVQIEDWLEEQLEHS